MKENRYLASFPHFPQKSGEQGRMEDGIHGWRIISLSGIFVGAEKQETETAAASGKEEEEINGVFIAEGMTI